MADGERLVQVDESGEGTATRVLSAGWMFARSTSLVDPDRLMGYVGQMEEGRLAASVSGSAGSNRYDTAAATRGRPRKSAHCRCEVAVHLLFGYSRRGGPSGGRPSIKLVSLKITIPT